MIPLKTVIFLIRKNQMYTSSLFKIHRDPALHKICNINIIDLHSLTRRLLIKATDILPVDIAVKVRETL